MAYFETKINNKIFDQIIAAFKVRGKRVELCRTTHMKTHLDLIKCTKLPEDTQICFLDDVFYPDMSNENIYYINVKPYIHDLDFNEMISRMLKNNIFNSKIDDVTYCKTFILKFMKRYNHIYVNKTAEAQNIDKILSKKILHHLHHFFKMKPIGPNITKTKRHKIIKNKTLKK